MPRERFRDGSDPVNPSPFDDPYAAAATAPGGNVNVVHGCYGHSFPLAGMTVGEARAQLEERMNIDPDAVAVLDGNDVDDEALLAEGQVLTFVKHAGEKGAVPAFPRFVPRPFPVAAGADPWAIIWSLPTEN